MSKKMLIDAGHQEEVRVAVVQNGKVEDFDFESESRRPLRGNIYLARVTRVEPSLQAAFVEYGGNRHGFLAFGEIHPDYYQIPVSDREALREAEAEEAALAAELENAGHSSVVDAETEAERSAHDDDTDDDSHAHDDADEDEEPHEDADALEAEHAGDSDDADEAGSDDGDSTGDNGDDEGDDDEIPANENDDERIAAQVDEGGEAGDDERSGAVALDAAPSPEISAALPDDNASENDADADQPEPAEANGSESGDSEEISNTGDAGDSGNTEDSGQTNAHAAFEADQAMLADPADARPARRSRKPASNSIRALEERYKAARAKRQRLLRNYKIQEVIKRRQVLLVQAVKEERGNKGAALTTYLSLAGRYCVLMPNTARGGGISRKITVAADRKRLRSVVGELEVPQGIGLIIRTAGAKRTKTEIKRDYDYLLRLWESIRTLTLKSIAPSLVYEEANLIKRAIRDLYDKDISQVVVEGEAGYREAKDFMKMLMPSHAKNVQQHKGKTPLFLAEGVEGQLDQMYQPTVRLKSGGYLVIHQTEALVAVDVNSGKATRERNIETTALKTNSEAAVEVARQCRLRDLAGLLVIDFIDMEESRNNRAVEKKLKDALKDDRARIQMGRISKFGLMEMSRQRRRSGIVDGTTHACPTCSGAGVVRSNEVAALRILRALEEEAIGGKAGVLTAKTAGDVALYILNQHRPWLSRIERTYGVTIEIFADDAKAGDQFDIDRRGTPRERPVDTTPVVRADRPDLPEEDETVEDESTEDREAASDHGADTADGADSNGRRKRRRRRRRKSGDGQADEARAERASPDDSGDDQDGADAGSPEHEGEQDGDKTQAQSTDSSTDSSTGSGENGEERGKRRRRRGRRGGRRNRRRDEDTQEGADEGDKTGAASGSDDEDAGADVRDAPAFNEADEPAAPAPSVREAASEPSDRPASSPEPEPEVESEAATGLEAEPAPAETAAPEPVAPSAPAPERTPQPTAEAKEPKDDKPARKGWWQRAMGG